MSAASEQAVAVVRASVMVYDDGGKRWLPAGQNGQHAESKVQLFQHLRVSTYRIVARKGAEHEVVLNCPLYSTMKYNQTTATFHQWRTEQRQLYGLNFVSQDDAQGFGQAVLRAVEALNLAGGGGGGGTMQQTTSQNGTYDHHPHNGGLPGVASAPALLRQQQQPPPQQQQQPGIYQQGGVQGQNFMPAAGDYFPQPHHQQQQRMSQDDGVQQQYQPHPNSVYQQQHSNEAYYGVSPALQIQKHQRQPSSGSNASSSGSSGGTTSQNSNLIYSTVAPPANVIPSPSRPAPPVPPPPPPSQMPPNAASKIPPAPPLPAGGVVPPAPPPPPPPIANGSAGGAAANGMPRQQINLAQAISNQKLRKVPSGASTTSGGPRGGDDQQPQPTMSKDARSASVGSVDTTLSTARGGGNGGGHIDVMSEMAATLARRRLIAESGSATSSGTITNGAETDSPTRANDKGPETKQKPWESRNGSRPSLNEALSSNTDSPRTHRKVPSGSSLSSQEDVGLSLMAGGANGGNSAPAPIGQQPSRSLSNGPTSNAAPTLITADALEQWKQEIMNDVRREINKAKADIIEALKQELNRR